MDCVWNVTKDAPDGCIGTGCEERPVPGTAAVIGSVGLWVPSSIWTYPLSDAAGNRLLLILTGYEINFCLILVAKIADKLFGKFMC